MAALGDESTTAPAEEAEAPVELEMAGGTIEYRWNDDEDTAPTPEAEAAPVAEAPTTPEEPPAQAAPSVAEDAPQPEPRNLADLTKDLTDDDIADLVKSDPRLKRRLDGEIGSRLQRERQEIERRAAEAERVRLLKEDDQFAEAWTKYEELEGKAETDPDEYEQYRHDPKYVDWKAKVLNWAQQRQIARTVQPEAFDPDQYRNEYTRQFNDDAKGIYVNTTRKHAPWFNEIPDRFRTAIENPTPTADSNWFEASQRAFVEGTNEAWTKRLNKAVEEARIAGRNEALAERVEDAPIHVTTPKTSRTAQQIIHDHAFGTAKVTQEEVAWAHRQLGFVSD